MDNILHITNGDSAGDSLMKTGLPGEVFVWKDILYEGPRNPGWPSETTLNARAQFLEASTAGGLDRKQIIEGLRNQYRKLEATTPDQQIVLWFDACLFDQSMLAHILTCLQHRGLRNVELLCVDAFPGIEPFNGLGQLQSEQLASLYNERRPVTAEQFCFANVADQAFSTQDTTLLAELSKKANAPLPWVPAAVTRWIQEQPDADTGLGRLETLALAAIRAGSTTTAKIFEAVAAADTPPQYWGDITLWAKINALAEREPPLIKIDGPMDRLPQWVSETPLSEFKIEALTNPAHSGKTI